MEHNVVSLNNVMSGLKHCCARATFNVNDIVAINDIIFRIIGFDHDRMVDDPYADTITIMGTTPINDRRMNDSSCRRGWIDTDLRKYLNEEYITTLPKELQDIIRPVKIFTHGSDGELYETHDRLFIPSESEMFGSAIYSKLADRERYEAFETSKDRVLMGRNGQGIWYWLRSATSATDFAVVSGGGIPGSGAAVGAFGVPLCFALSYID